MENNKDNRINFENLKNQNKMEEEEEEAYNEMNVDKIVIYKNK
jgi:hypothetical protein